MDAEKYLKERGRMSNGCDAYSCSKCGLDSLHNRHDITCTELEHEYPEEAVAIVEQWAKEHPVRTYKSVFLEMFPNVKTTKEGHPDFCLKRLLGAKGERDICSCDITCGDCWDREVEE